MPSGKCWMHSVCGRHNASRMQPTFSGKCTHLFITSDLYQALTEFVKVHKTPVTLNGHIFKIAIHSRKSGLKLESYHICGTSSRVSNTSSGM